MISKGLGQYDSEYANCSCFWGAEPGKYVNLLLEHLSGGRVLDLGAGEGKNAIHLAALGFDVIAVECSRFAITNFARRLNNLDSAVRARIEMAADDVLKYQPSGTFEGVIAYGLLHCLPNLEKVDAVVQMMKIATSPGGYNVIATFTNRLPVPVIHHYLEATLISENYLTTRYSDWTVLSYENELIEEVHPTSRIPHKHSICRLLARRDYDGS